MLELTYNQNIEKASIFCLHEIYVGYISISHMCIFNATLKLRETTSYRSRYITKKYLRCSSALAALHTKKYLYRWCFQPVLWNFLEKLFCGTPPLLLLEEINIQNYASIEKMAGIQQFELLLLSQFLNRDWYFLTSLMISSVNVTKSGKIRFLCSDKL